MKTDYIKISDDVKLYYQEQGEGQPLLFVPGWSMSTVVFHKQFEYFSKNYRVISYDPRAYGKSSKTTDGFDYMTHGRDLKAVIDYLDLKNPIIAPWSYGTLTGYAYVNQFGFKNLKAMIMIDGSPKPRMSNDCKWATQTELMCSMFGALIHSPEHTLKKFCLSILEPAVSAEDEKWFMDQARMTPNEIRILSLADALNVDFREDARKMDGNVPVLNIVKKDMEKIASKWLKENAPNSEIAACGSHTMFWQQSDKFNSIVENFLAKIN